MNEKSNNMKSDKSTSDLSSKENKSPIVLVHGYLGGMGDWRYAIDALAEQRSLYAIDLLGFGRSGRPQFSQNGQEAEMELVEAIEAWRREMGLEKMVLCGHSFGGYIITAYALKYAHRLSGLILEEPWGKNILIYCYCYCYCCFIYLNQ